MKREKIVRTIKRSNLFIKFVRVLIFLEPNSWMIQVCKNLRKALIRTFYELHIILNIMFYYRLYRLRDPMYNSTIIFLLCLWDTMQSVFISDSMVLLDSRKAEWENEKNFWEILRIKLHTIYVLHILYIYYIIHSVFLPFKTMLITLTL